MALLGDVSAVLCGHGGVGQDVGDQEWGGLCVGKPDRGQPLQRHWDKRGKQDSPLGDSDQPPGVEGCRVSPDRSRARHTPSLLRLLVHHTC